LHTDDGNNSPFIGQEVVGHPLDSGTVTRRVNRLKDLAGWKKGSVRARRGGWGKGEVRRMAFFRTTEGPLEDLSTAGELKPATEITSLRDPTDLLLGYLLRME